MNRSVFPNQIDTFLEHFDIQANDMVHVKRFQELKLKQVLKPDEQAELQSLTVLLREKLFSPEDFNKLQDCITNLEVFFRDNVQGFVATKQTEMNTFVTDKKNEVTAKFNSTVTALEDKKNYFVEYVGTKEDEVRSLVQDFDTRTNRYYTSWTAADNQTEFNIYLGTNQNIPLEANLNISEEHVDLSINGVLQTPYVDYVIIKNSNFDTIKLISNAASLISAGTEIVARWYKNVGKLYFKHSGTHGVGSSDPIIVTEGMLDNLIKNKLKMLDKKITVSHDEPENPNLNDVWIDIN